MNQLEFRPDLIVEATNACDRVCPGCYAPNVVVGAAGGAAAFGVMHLAPELLAEAWPSDESVGVVSIRGGEPTLNPAIARLIELACARAACVYLETSGGWISPGHPLLEVLRKSGCVAKVSLDKMHGTSRDEARRKLDVLAQAGVKAAAAITECTPEQFKASRARLLEGFQGEVFWQKKAAAAGELVRPAIGVISTAGHLKKEVSHHLDAALAR